MEVLNHEKEKLAIENVLQLIDKCQILGVVNWEKGIDLKNDLKEMFEELNK